MDSALEAFLYSWPFDPWLVAGLSLAAAIYFRGWRILQRRGRRFDRTHLVCFLGGLFTLFLALASPIDPFASLLLQVHMLQHLLLMIVVPPLLWRGAPFLPMLRGLPEAIRIHALGPFLRYPPLRELFVRLCHPLTGWILFAAATWIWHAPPLYELALSSDTWHYWQHACFLGAGLLFWYPVVQPFPSRPIFSRWLMLPYLLLADVQNTVLSALFVFSDRVFYPHYEAVPRLWGITALNDQAVAGLLMWVPGSFAFLVPLVCIAQRLLYGSRRVVGRSVVPARIPLPLVTAPAPTEIDLLRSPVLGRFLHWRYARTALQVPMLLLAGLIVLDGLLGPPIAPLNLAGVLPWIHWRGFVVLALLVAGNVFCMACPFTLPRRLARRWLPTGRPWPRPLRSKWLAVALLVLFFWAYETFALWSSPWWTAWIALGYFVAAFVIDSVFRGAAFCKYVCPIGQFNFVQSLVSPLEVRVRDIERCRTCTTHDCLRGQGTQPGCELHLFAPRKAGNMDCTFCLDCIHACPHDNIGIHAGLPGRDLVRDPPRSGVGRFSRRPDLAALVLVLVFAAFANAAAMVAPVADGAERCAILLGLSSTRPLTGSGLILAVTLLPMLAAGLAATIGHWWSGDSGRRLEIATRFSFALVPLGFGMWLAHYSFHFFTGWDAVQPVLQRWGADLGFGFLGEWSCCCSPVAPWLIRLEILFLDLGFVLSLYLGYRTALERCKGTQPALRALAPWALLMLLLFGCGVWLLFQPMEMRGLMMG